MPTHSSKPHSASLFRAAEEARLVIFASSASAAVDTDPLAAASSMALRSFFLKPSSMVLHAASAVVPLVPASDSWLLRRAVDRVLVHEGGHLEALLR